MEAQEQIDKFKDFIEKNYLTTLTDNIRHDRKFLVIDFNELSRFNLELAELLLEQPEDTIKVAELAIEQFDIENSENTKVRFNNLPESQYLAIGSIRSKHLNKMYRVEGIIRQKSDVRPQVTAAKFECPSCSNIINVLQLDTAFKEPSRCGCGRKGKFHLISKELIDAQGIILEEDPEKLEGDSQPKRMNVFLKDDLVSPISEKKTAPGSKIKVIGIVKEIPIILRTGTKSTKFDLLIEANYAESAEETFYELETTPEDIRKIKEIVENPKCRYNLIESIAPSIYGYDRVKEAILLQMVGGVQKVRNDGIISRGDMHVLLVGDPGCHVAGTKILLADGTLKNIENIVPNKQGEYNLSLSLQVGNEVVNADKGFVYENQRAILIETNEGMEIGVTPNHPLYLENKGWTRADTLKIGDRILRHREILINKQDNGITKEYARIVGLLIAEGWREKRGNHKRIGIGLPLKELFLLKQFTKDFKKEFSISPKIYRVKKSNGRKDQLWCRFKHNGELFDLLVLQHKRVIPEKLFNASNKVIVEFLKYYFEGDGFVLNKRRYLQNICCKTTSRKLAQQIKLLLMRFGINCHISTQKIKNKNWHQTYLIKIVNKKNTFMFARKINFVSVMKKRKLSCFNYQRNVSTEDDYVQIKQITELPPQTVYDLHIPKNHYFWANGFHSHNSAKSALLKRANLVAPKSRYISGKGSSAAGLTASVVKDEFLKGWSLEAGAMVLASNGLCCIDELNLMDDKDKSGLHEALENQTVSISKATIQATLSAKTTVLAAANPKFGRFDPYGIISDQIDLSPPLVNRFDLIFTIKDTPDKKRDGELASHMLSLHQNPKSRKSPIEPKLLKKYIGYAKRKINPKLTDEAVREIKRYYLKMRDSVGGEGKATAIPISPRQLEALVRLSEANARIRLSGEVTKKDAEKAINLLEFSLKDVAFDFETGKIDIDKIATGTTSSQRSNIIIIKSIIRRLKDRFNNIIPIDDILADAVSQGVTEDKIEELVQKMKNVGDIFEPRHGFISIIGDI